LACAHAAAAAREVPLWQYLDCGRACMPLPMVNMISGGLHAGGNLPYQDFMFVPLSSRSYSEALRITVAVYRALGNLLQKTGHESVLVGDEGGFGPKLLKIRRAFELTLDASGNAGLTLGRDAAIAIDVASTHFFREQHYYVGSKQPLHPSDLAFFLKCHAERDHVVSIEDGMAEDDWDGWKLLTKELGNKVQLIGDDLFTTNPERLQRGIDEKVANAILIKPNQIGTLTETLAVIEQARAAGYRTIISARSGETEDTTIADLAVATGAGQIKIGSVARSERLAKYNQLLRIEEQMGPNAPFAKWEPVG
jgi:enolase